MSSINAQQSIKFLLTALKHLAGNQPALHVFQQVVEEFDGLERQSKLITVENMELRKYFYNLLF